MFFIRHKQASVNKRISKQMKKNPTRDLKNHLWGSSGALKDF